MNELELIRWLRKRAAAGGRGIPIPPGDDAAGVSDLRRGPSLLTTDMLIEGVHFGLDRCTPRQAGRKAMARGISDIAAMFGRPRYALVAVAFGENHTQDQVRDLCRGLFDSARSNRVEVVGGDVASGVEALTVCVTIVGETGPRGPVRRGGARPGDWVMVTGSLGGSILGRHLRFRPRWREALRIAECAPVHAAIDLSDGLSTDAWHICRESSVAITIYADSVPVSSAAKRLAAGSGRTPLDHALNDGEDYELLFAVSRRSAQKLLRRRLGVAVRCIGEVSNGHGLYLEQADGHAEPLAAGGWDHLERREARGEGN